MKSPPRAFCWVFASVALAGCAGTYGPQSLQTGTSLDQVTATMGRPTARYTRAGGERVEYARGPYGRHTYMLDFDAQDRLTGWQQVLAEPIFNEIRSGMTRDELLMAIGHPSESQTLAHQQRMLWSYRYETPFCQWFQVGLDRQDRVVDSGYGPDPRCDANFSTR